MSSEVPRAVFLFQFDDLCLPSVVLLFSDEHVMRLFQLMLNNILPFYSLNCANVYLVGDVRVTYVPSLTC